MKIVCCTLLILFCFNLGYSQTKTDSLIQDFLIRMHEVDSIIYKEEKSRNTITIQSNYFKKKELELTKPTKRILVYIFGSYSAHADNFILIEITSKEPGIYSYLILGKKGLEQDLEELLNVFKKNIDLAIGDKKKMIQILLKVY
jgi:hypothetical protein